jgi:ubiquinone/menaquinone biosynthesis C-methylase UbiE
LPKLNSKWSKEKRITPLQANVENLPFQNSTFDRVIVTCLLHHIEKPQQALEEINRVLKANGAATIFLSCDPGVLVRLLRTFSTKHRARKQGFDGYSLMIAREHRNHVGSLLEMARHVFRDRKLKIEYHPFKVPSWNLNGYIILKVS